MTDDAAAIRDGLVVYRTTLEDGIARLLANFTDTTGLVVTKIWLGDDGAVACRVELGREGTAAATPEPSCCEHDAQRHAKDGCWAMVPAEGLQATMHDKSGRTMGLRAHERCSCRQPPPARTGTDV